MSRIKNFTQGMKYMLLQHVLNVISGVFIGAMVTRHYGPELFGVFSLASFYGAIVGSIAGLGVGDLLAAQLMKKKDTKEGLFWSVLLIKFATFLLFWSIVYCYLKFSGAVDIVLEGYTILFVAGFLGSINLLSVIARSHQRNDIIAIIGMVTLLVSIAFRSYIVLTDRGLVYLYWDVVIKVGLDLLLLAAFLSKRQMHYSFARPEWKAGMSLVCKSLPLMLTSFLVLLGGNVGLLMLSELVGIDSAGRFAALIRLYSFVLFIGHAISSNLFYYMESSGEEAARFLELYLAVILKLLAALSYVVIIGSYLFARPFVEFLYGSKYEGIGLNFSIVTTSVLFLWATIPAHLKQLSEMQAKKILLINIISIGFNFAATYFAISFYGERGAYFIFPLSALLTMVLTFCWSGMKSQLRLVIVSYLKPIPNRNLLADFSKS